MKFGAVPLDEAEGALLAHSMRLDGRRLKKGITLDDGHLAALAAAGLAEVIVARLELGDLHENVAAERLAAALVPDPSGAGLRLTAPFAGRVNVIARGPGVAVLDTDALAAFNSVNPMITLASVPVLRQMRKGGMLATIKVISYAVPGGDVMRACMAARGALRLAGPVHRGAGLVVTQIPGGPDDAKGIAAIRARLAALGMELTQVLRVAHRVDALAEALTGVLSGALSGARADMALILTGSATMDIDDVAPAALRLAGGRVERFGMPVDPGNLLFLGDLQGRPVIGLPGCARSPALNGADWVLSRVACGIAVGDKDIAAMGVGGLLKEIPTRPQPRAGRD